MNIIRNICLGEAFVMQSQKETNVQKETLCNCKKEVGRGEDKSQHSLTER